jgi:hypothetical protein
VSARFVLPASWATPIIGAVAALALGVVIGLFVGKFLVAPNFTVEALGALVAIIAGGLITNIVARLGQVEALALYLIGLLVGVGVYLLGVNQGWIPNPPSPSPSDATAMLHQLRSENLVEGV